MSTFPVRFTAAKPAVYPETLIEQGITRTIIRKKLAEMQALGKTEPGFPLAEGPELVRHFDSVESATEFKTFLIDVCTSDETAQEFAESARNAVIETV